MARRSSVLAEDLARHIRRRILAGEYAPGESVTETGVASEYGVARPTARSALERLVTDGLLVRHAFASLRVRSVPRDDLDEVVALLEFLEARALERVLGGDVDVRPLRDAVDDSLHALLDALVRVSGSERLSRMHRPCTFEFILGLNQLVDTGDSARNANDRDSEVREQTAARGLSESVFRREGSSARSQLQALWDYRRALIPAPTPTPLATRLPQAAD